MPGNNPHSLLRQNGSCDALPVSHLYFKCIDHLYIAFPFIISLMSRSLTHMPYKNLHRLSQLHLGKAAHIFTCIPGNAIAIKPAEFMSACRPQIKFQVSVCPTQVAAAPTAASLMLARLAPQSQ